MVTMIDNNSHLHPLPTSRRKKNENFGIFRYYCLLDFHCSLPQNHIEIEVLFLVFAGTSGEGSFKGACANSALDILEPPILDHLI